MSEKKPRTPGPRAAFVDFARLEGAVTAWRCPGAEPRGASAFPVVEGAMIQERSSLAVKAALKSVLAAPMASGTTKKAEKGKAHA